MDNLSPNERILWHGVPRQGLLLRAADALMIPFSLLWGGFSVFLEYSVLCSDAPMVLRLWTVPFVLMGVHMVGGRFALEAWQRSRIDYMVTNERVIIRSGIFRRSVQSLALRTMGDFALTEHSNGEGTISFGVSADGDRFSGLAAFPGDETVPRFDTIADARSVYEIIRGAHLAAGHTRPFGQRLG